MFPLRIATVLAIGLALSGCMTQSSSVAGAGANTVGASMGSSTPPSSPDPNANQEEYRITPLDELEVTVFQLPDLTRTAQVGATGQITLPLLGAVQASGKTARELEANIATALRAKYLQAPQVSVQVKKSVMQRVTVEGAVKKPGVRSITGPTTLMQVIAECEGLDQLADPQGIVVFRNTPAGRTAAKFDMNAIRSGKMPDPTVRAGDLIVVDESGVKSAWKNLKDLLPAAGVFAFLL